MDNISLKSYSKDLRSFDVVSAIEQTKMVIKAKSGDDIARKKLIECNLRFVVSVAKQYLWSGISLGDLINEGNIGLIRAVDKFDENREYNFISYAVWWIRQAVMQSIYDNSNTVRLPVNRINLSSKITKAKDTLFKNLNREPNNGELADFLTSATLKVTEEDIAISVIDSQKEIYLDSEIKEESDSKFIDFMESDGFEDIEYSVNRGSLRSEINTALSGLNERENTIITLYFGLDGGCNRTLSEIGEVLSLTNERVRQIKEFALKKLRTYNKSSKLREFLSCKL